MLKRSLTFFFNCILLGLGRCDPNDEIDFHRVQAAMRVSIGVFFFHTLIGLGVLGVHRKADYRGDHYNLVVWFLFGLISPPKDSRLSFSPSLRCYRRDSYVWLVSQNPPMDRFNDDPFCLS